mmetsp:Transcript_6930/g.10558  ORF Transcript_6930/g.10558 Transcript_6930/m.10558 type:complete len:357 (-) Transcript_6930:60-1130(-)
MTITLQQTLWDVVRVFREYQAVSKALKQQLIQAIPKVYLESLRDAITNTIAHPISGIIQNLFDTYGKVTAQKIAEETDKVTSFTFDPVQPVGTVYTLVENLTVLAEAGRAPYSPQQVTTFAYNVLLKTRKFSNDIKNWNRLPPLQKVWIAFKQHFQDAQEELRETGELRLDETFHYANLVRDIVSGLSNDLQSPRLDNISLSDTIADSFRLPLVQSHHSPPPPLVYDHYGGSILPLPPGSNVIPPLQANAVTSSDINGLMSQIAQMQTTTNTLLSSQHAAQQQYAKDLDCRGRGGRDGRGGRGERAGKGPPRRDKYCCTHGVCAHSSNKCRAPAAGHQTTATFQNKQGGSTKSCPT